MAEGTDSVKDCLSCDDSSYGERNLEVYNSGDGVNIVEARTRNTAVAIQTCWERSLTSLNLREPIGRLCDSGSCSY